MTASTTKRTESLPASARADARVFVVDPHPFLRLGLMDWLKRQRGLACCGGVDGIVASRRTLRQARPDLVVTDIRFPDGDGLTLIRLVRELCPAARVLVLSQIAEEFCIERVLRAGASGYVSKLVTPEKVLEAVRSVLTGQIYVDSALGIALLHRMIERPRLESPLSSLSEREFEVFQMLGAGLSTRKIGEKLCLSHKTIETHRENIKHKLALPDSRALVRQAATWLEGAGRPGDSLQ